MLSKFNFFAVLFLLSSSGAWADQMGPNGDRFYEEAARLRDAIKAFHLKVIHAESLHAHDAVAESRWTRASA